MLVDCDGVVSESFNGKKLKHLLVQGIEDEKVVFEARVGLKQSKLTYPDAVRFVEQQGGKLGDKMLVAGLSAFRETFNIEATKLQSHGVEVDLLFEDWYWSSTPSQENYFMKVFYGKWLPYGEFYQLSILGAGDFLIAILAMKKSESQKRFAFFICSIPHGVFEVLQSRRVFQIRVVLGIIERTHFFCNNNGDWHRHPAIV